MRFYSIFLTCILGSFTLAVSAQEKTKIEITQANSLEGKVINGIRVTKLIGNVGFKQGNVIMTCDSAYLYEESNSVEAFGHVSILSSNGVRLNGNLLKYNGNAKIAEVFERIVLIDKTTELRTSYITYDLNTDIGSYPQQGVITDGENKLISLKGYYNAKQKEYFFKDSVRVINPEYTMKADTLKYNTVSKITYFYGPTYIYSKENTLYCERGSYNTSSGQAFFSKNAQLSSDKHILYSDSLYYNRKLGLGTAFRNVRMVDTAQSSTIRGQYGVYDRLKQKATITDNPYLEKVFKDSKDTLFLRSDTMVSLYDSTTDIRRLYAFRHVKIFKKDLQGSCDSIYYSTEDSLLRLYGAPILWSDENQLTAKEILVQISNKSIDKMYLNTEAFIASEEDSVRYNQIKGKNMTGYFTEGKLRRIKVEGNGQSIYYGRDGKDKLMGVNRADCSNMWIYMQDSKVQRINLINSPDATFYPIKELSPKELLLKGFLWLGGKRPSREHVSGKSKK